MSTEQREQLVRHARSICWEFYGVNTEDFSDLQCLIRAAHWSLDRVLSPEESLDSLISSIDSVNAFLDLAEEFAGEIDK